jgi:hypothetical protein
MKSPSLHVLLRLFACTIAAAAAALFQLLLLEPCRGMNNKPPPPPGQAKLNYSKARRVKTRSIFQENQTQQSKKPERTTTPKIPRLIPEPDKPVFELFVRSIGSPWVRFRDVYGTDTLIQSAASEVVEGGIVAESLREFIDSWIAIKIFGNGFGVLGGETETISDVKELLPAFKKVRQREMEFGYRLLADEESISVLTKAMRYLRVCMCV